MMRMSRASMVLLGVFAAVVIAVGVSLTPAYTFNAGGTMTCPLCNAN